uniref:Uncharacterized protein n=1 Tax=Tanacetum cinerariifolium TaxID=118510 RepID=A0A6L2K705_TANCI|nr:hypothetical protein [Tanacetum cinerariifolium]
MSGDEPTPQMGPVESPQMVSTVNLPILKKGIYELDIDDLYNNLKVFEADIKGHGSSGQASSSSYADDLMFSFFASQSNSPQLDDEDLEQIDHDDLECRAPRNQGNRNGDAGYRNMDNNKRTVPVESSDALVILDNALIVQDGLGYDWSYIAQDEPTKFSLMAYTLGSDQELSESNSEVLTSVIDSRSSDGDDNQTNDRFKKSDGYHAVPPPLTGNYMPPLADLSFEGLDDSIYKPTANKSSASISKDEASVIKTSNISVEMPKVDSVRTSGVLIED